MGIEFIFNTLYIKTKTYMQTITPAQARAIEVITKSLDTIVPGRGKDYMDVILGILNLEMPTQTECTSILYTGIGNDTPIKSLEGSEEYLMEYPMEDAVEESVKESIH